MLGLLLVVTFEEVKQYIDALNDAYKEVVLLMINEVLLLANQKQVVAHAEASDVKVHEHGHSHDQVEVPQPVIIWVHQELIIRLEEPKLQLLEVVHVLGDLVVISLHLLLHLQHLLSLYLLHFFLLLLLLSQSLCSQSLHDRIGQVLLPYLVVSQFSGDGPKLLPRSCTFLG